MKVKNLLASHGGAYVGPMVVHVGSGRAVPDSASMWQVVPQATSWAFEQVWRKDIVRQVSRQAQEEGTWCAPEPRFSYSKVNSVVIMLSLLSSHKWHAVLPWEGTPSLPIHCVGACFTVCIPP